MLRGAFLDSNLASFHDIICDTVSSYSNCLYIYFMNKRSLTFDPRLSLFHSFTGPTVYWDQNENNSKIFRLFDCFDVCLLIWVVQHYSRFIRPL